MCAVSFSPKKEMNIYDMMCTALPQICYGLNRIYDISIIYEDYLSKSLIMTSVQSTKQIVLYKFISDFDTVNAQQKIVCYLLKNLFNIIQYLRRTYFVGAVTLLI